MVFVSLHVRLLVIVANGSLCVEGAVGIVFRSSVYLIESNIEGRILLQKGYVSERISFTQR